MTGSGSFAGIGERIAAARKLAGLKQEQLASRATYSTSLLRQVEQGRQPASPGFVAAVARALDIEPEQLTGAPYRDAWEADGPLEGLAELRAILAEGTYVRPVEPPSLAELVAEMAAIDSAYRNDRGRLALRRLHPHLRQLYGALHAAGSADEQARVSSVICNAYVTAERLCRRFGFLSMATPAIDRLEWFADRASDPLYVAQAKVKRCRLLMYLGSTDVGLKLVEDGLDSIESSDAPALAVRGYGHLAGAITAARGRKPEAAQRHLTEARRLAKHLDGESDAYGTLFGPANVAIHACAVELEAGDPEKAARTGSELTLPREIAPPRAGHHWQDTARAWLLSGHPDKALKSLQRARRVAPQQTRLHPSVRETLHGIAAAERRRSESLAMFAHWAQVSL